jgi:hypothetical protein
MLKNYSLNQLLVLLTSVGFLFLTADSLIEHWTILTQDWPAFIPVVFSALGFIAGVMTIKSWNNRWIRRLHIFLYATILVACLGLYYHIVEEEDEDELTAEQREHEAKEKDKPLLAPLSFAGLGAVGLLGTSRKWPAEVI